MKCFKQKGFSLMEVMIGVGLLGIISVGISQLVQNSNKELTKFSDKLELKSITNLISQEYSKPEACTGQFQNSFLNNPSIPDLKSGTRLLLKVSDKVASSRFEVKKIETNALDKTRFLLKITFKDLKTDIERIEDLAIAAKINESTGRIENCYHLGNPTGESEGTCNGPGAIPGTDGSSCTIKGFPPVGIPVCPVVGEVFSGITSTNEGNYQASCKAPLEKNISSCPNEHIKQYTLDGKIECVTLGNYVDSEPAVVSSPSYCQLTSQNNKISLVCTPGDPDEFEPGFTPPTTGGWNCFIAGTEIKMSSGEVKNIEDVELGDKLLDGSNKVVTVLKLLPREYSGKIYSINGGEYFFTPNHPFKTPEGWKSIDPEQTNQESPELKTTKLNVGDILIKSDSLELILTLDSIYTNQMVYNFSLTGSHEYIANDYVVHNKYDCPAAQNNCPPGENSVQCGVQQMPFGYAQTECPSYCCQ